MQKVEDFMYGLFLARIAEEKHILASRAPYRQKYFATDCQWDSRVGTLEMIETEAIVGVEESDLEVTVITAYKIPFIVTGVQTHRRRYHLKAVAERWLIQRVEKECPACRGQGDENCLYCKGRHWLGTGPAATNNKA